MLIYQQALVKKANYKVRPLWTTKASPDFLSVGSRYGLIQIPLYLQMTDATMDQLILEKVIIAVNDPSDHAIIDEIVASLIAAIGEISSV